MVATPTEQSDLWTSWAQALRFPIADVQSTMARQTHSMIRELRYYSQKGKDVCPIQSLSVV